MSKVFVVDANTTPLEPVHCGRARLLLKAGKAVVWRRYPFCIRLKRVVEQPVVAGLRFKIDPGSKTTGLALVNDETGEVVWIAELTHRGQEIVAAVRKRAALRRGRRQRTTRYRKPRWHNRRRTAGWLPPSLLSRLAQIETWVCRVRKLCHITAISVETVRFDTHAIQNPEITGQEYQQGALFGYELREYLLEKFQRQCCYCGKKDLPLQIEHLVPRSRGGSNRASNLCLACETCNTAKGTQDVRDFLKTQPERLARLLAQAKAPLKDAAAVNSLRWALYERLNRLGVPVEEGTGGRTKWQRTMRALPKTHYWDAVCVGASTPLVLSTQGKVVPWLIEATGHGKRQMCGVSEAGFPTRHRRRRKLHHGFQTGDIARAVVLSGKKTGRYTGRVLVRASGYFDLDTGACRITGIAARFCSALHRTDGYAYRFGKAETIPSAQSIRQGGAIPPLAEAQGHPGPIL
ncbi:MAG: RNA-guided endonuclease IscB [Chloroflexota bacterium]|nr:RNA-guided endonuclease IscB [Chloroflexota bacterium]